MENTEQCLRFNGHGCCRNKELILVFLQMRHFCFPDLGNEKLCSILVFGDVRFNIVVRSNHANVASRGAVGRTHTIVRLQTSIRRKDGPENLGVSYMYWMDFHNGILCCGFLWPRLISVYLFRLPRPTVSFSRLPRQGLPRPIYTPRAITPLPPLHGYHACVYISRLSRHSLVISLGYHTRAITLHHTRTSGYHTRHSSS